MDLAPGWTVGTAAMATNVTTTPRVMVNFNGFGGAIRVASDWKLGKLGLAEGGVGHRLRSIRNGWMGSRAEQRGWNMFLAATGGRGEGLAGGYLYLLRTSHFLAFTETFFYTVWMLLRFLKTNIWGLVQLLQ